jgi:hypothetical protein
VRWTDLPPITSSRPGSFANGVIRERHPAIVQQISGDTPFTPSQTSRLEALSEENVAGHIAPLREGAHDAEYWSASGKDFIGQRWTDVPFLWAEGFFYRRLLEAVEFYEPGPWHWLDPFQRVKGRELHSDPMTSFLEKAEALRELPADKAFAVLLHGSLLGNRADLGFYLGPVGEKPPGQSFEVLVDDTERIWEHLVCSGPRQIALLADNAGLELMADLLLCDFLLRRHSSATVVIHVKPVPYYVSDATAADVLAVLQRLGQDDGTTGESHRRLEAAIRSGRLTFETDPFYSRPECYFNAPPRVMQLLGAADLVIVKGDLNYRRLVGDLQWDPTVPFEEVCDYFPTPLVALRTLKSELAVGLDRGLLSQLNSSAPDWMVSGLFGVIQSRLQV